ncbi:prenyltransferase [candidate division WWE3 bacterium]|nr:prenyltransferase [candidate division WWE3 bacterium]
MIHRIIALLNFSRPRFWMYLIGPYLIGYACGISHWTDFFTNYFFAYAIYFLIVANCLLYGVNDLYDSDTDSRNPKKLSYEKRVSESHHKTIKMMSIISGVVGLGIALIAPSRQLQFLMVGFNMLSVLYSAPPVRFKATPVFDSLSNILYALPGFFGYTLSSDNTVPGVIIAVCCCWTMAMHLFSAIPDIQADKSAHLDTSAVLLGPRIALLTCGLLWLAPALFLSFKPDFFPFSIFMWVYPITMFWLLFQRVEYIFRTYQLFPYINSSIGAILFFVIISTKPI